MGRHKESNKYKVIGDYAIILIDRNNGNSLEVIIDSEDLHKVLSVGGKWSFTNGYAAICSYTNRKKKLVYMHRIIMDAPNEKHIDHIDGNRLNNRKPNLRLVVHKENLQNLKSGRKNNKSGVRGVSWDARDSLWVAQVFVDGVKHYIGRYTDISIAENDIVEARKRLMPFSNN